MSFGHEPVGVVVEVGEDVHGFKPGYRVSGRFACNSEYAIADHDKVFLIPDNVNLENAKRYGADEIYTPNELPAVHFSRPGLRPMQTGFEMVMEWGKTAESLDLAIQMPRMCGQLAIGAYHTGRKQPVEVQTLNFKAIDCFNTSPNEADLNRRTSITAMRMLADDSCNFKHVATRVYPLSRFDQAQSELTRKYGKFIKAIVSFVDKDFEPYIIE